MNAPILQVTGLIVLLFLFHYTYLQYRRRIFNIYDFAGWIIVWSILLVMAIFPQILEPLIEPEILFFRALDAVLVSSITILLVACFYTYRKMRIVEDKMKQLVRLHALNGELDTESMKSDK